MKKANNELVKQMTQDNPLLKEVLDSQKVYMQKVRPWSEISDYNYLKQNIQE
jgi:TRAP-type mannitol/chloroaromatic compound transport system substrate-binding protein